MQKTVYTTILSFTITLFSFGQTPAAIIKGTLMATDAGFGGNEFVVAQNVETGNEIKTKKGDIKFGEGFKASYTLKVPPGKYYIYSKTPNEWDIAAYYTEFVTCGLNYNCPSHKKIIVNAISGKTLLKIDPSDNYYTDPKQLEGNITSSPKVNFGQNTQVSKPFVTKDSLLGYWEGTVYDKRIVYNDELGIPYEYFGMYPTIKINITGLNAGKANVLYYQNEFDDSQRNLKNDLSVKYRDSATMKLNLENDSTLLLPYYQIEGKDTCQGNAVLIIRYDERFKGLYLIGTLKGKGANCSNYRFSFRKVNRTYLNYYDSLYKKSSSTPDKTKIQKTDNAVVDFSNTGNNNSNLSTEELRKKEEEENRKNIERMEQRNKEEKMAPVDKKIFSGSTTPSDLGKKLITAIKTNNKTLWYNCILRDTKEKCDADLEQIRKCLMSKGVDNWSLLTFSRVTYSDDTKKGGDLSYFKIEFKYGKDFVGAIGGGNFALQYNGQYMVHHSYSSCLIIRE